MTALVSFTLDYLLNSLWQVPLLFIAAWTAARLAHPAGPRLEHRIWVGALLLQILLPACAIRLPDPWQTLASLVLWRTRMPGAGGVASVAVAAETVHAFGLLRLPVALRVLLVLAYGCSVLYFAARLAWGAWTTHRLRRDAEPAKLPASGARIWQRCRRVFASREMPMPVVASSARIDGPVTVGFRRGVLLLPPGWIDALSEGDLETVLAHEFAHMQRHDFAKNLAYSVMALPLAWHPLLWLTRARLTESREMICDALAAEVVAGPEIYARSLLRLAAMVSRRSQATSLHAIGIFDANIFERRLMNLTQQKIEIPRSRRMLAGAACIALALATCTSALALRLQVAASEEGNEAPKKLVQKPKDGVILIKKAPVYPAEARAKKDTLDGAVILHVIIAKDGVPRDIRVKKSLRTDYDRSAIDAVRQWRYQPYLVDGAPVEVDTDVEITYSMTP